MKVSGNNCTIFYLLYFFLFAGCSKSKNPPNSNINCYPVTLEYVNSAGASGISYSYSYDQNNRLNKAISADDTFEYLYDNTSGKLSTMKYYKKGTINTTYEFVYLGNGNLDKIYHQDRQYYQQFSYDRPVPYPSRSTYYGKSGASPDYLKLAENYIYMYDEKGNLIKREMYEDTLWIRNDEFTYDNKTPFFKAIPQFIWYYATPLKPEWAVNNLVSHKVTELYPFPGGTQRNYTYTYSYEFNEQSYPINIQQTNTLSDRTINYRLTYNCK